MGNLERLSVTDKDQPGQNDSEWFVQLELLQVP